MNDTVYLAEEQLEAIIDAALFVAGQPLTPERLLQLFDEDNAPSKDAIKAALAHLQTNHTHSNLLLIESGAGFQYQVKQELSPWLCRLWDEKPQRYSRAFYETLALIAYRQPITRAEIEDVRGVAVSTSIIKSMQEREWVKVVGHRDAPGKPAIYGTTKHFLDYFNLKSLSELPSLLELQDLDTVESELAETLEASNQPVQQSLPMEQGDADAALDFPDVDETEKALPQ